MTLWQEIITVAVVTFGTLLTRFLPFMIFPEGKTPPKYTTYLGRVLPYAVMGLLIVFCLKDAVFDTFHGLPEFLAIALIIVLHRWKKNMFLSMGVGTFFYMFLVQNWF